MHEECYECEQCKRQVVRRGTLCEVCRIGHTRYFEELKMRQVQLNDMTPAIAPYFAELDAMMSDNGTMDVPRRKAKSSCIFDCPVEWQRNDASYWVSYPTLAEWIVEYKACSKIGFFLDPNAFTCEDEQAWWEKNYTSKLDYELYQ